MSTNKSTMKSSTTSTALPYTSKQKNNLDETDDPQSVRTTINPLMNTKIDTTLRSKPSPQQSQQLPSTFLQSYQQSSLPSNSSFNTPSFLNQNQNQHLTPHQSNYPYSQMIHHPHSTINTTSNNNNIINNDIRKPLSNNVSNSYIYANTNTTNTPHTNTNTTTDPIPPFSDELEKCSLLWISTAMLASLGANSGYSVGGGFFVLLTVYIYHGRFNLIALGLSCISILVDLLYLGFHAGTLAYVGQEYLFALIMLICCSIAKVGAIYCLIRRHPSLRHETDVIPTISILNNLMKNIKERQGGRGGERVDGRVEKSRGEREREREREREKDKDREKEHRERERVTRSERGEKDKSRDKERDRDRERRHRERERERERRDKEKEKDTIKDRDRERHTSTPSSEDSLLLNPIKLQGNNKDNNHKLSHTQTHHNDPNEIMSMMTGENQLNDSHTENKLDGEIKLEIKKKKKNTNIHYDDNDNDNDESNDDDDNDDDDDEAMVGTISTNVAGIDTEFPHSYSDYPLNVSMLQKY